MGLPSGINSAPGTGRSGQHRIAQDHHTGSASNIQSSSQSPTIIEERLKLPNGETTYRQYIKGKFLGKGGFAMCYEFVQCETKQVSAAKVIKKSSLQRSRAKQKLMSEIKIHRSVKHQNIA